GANTAVDDSDGTAGEELVVIEVFCDKQVGMRRQVSQYRPAFAENHSFFGQDTVERGIKLRRVGDGDAAETDIDGRLARGQPSLQSFGCGVPGMRCPYGPR